MPAIGVVRMSMRQNRLSDRFPRVDIKIALTAIQPSISQSYQADSFHVMSILQRRNKIFATNNTNSTNTNSLGNTVYAAFRHDR